MRRKAFRSIDDVLGSGILGSLPVNTAKGKGSDRVLKSTRLEDKIYSELREDDSMMNSIEQECSGKLPTFSSLSRDVYQSFYSLNVRKKDETELSDTAKLLNSHILEDLMSGDEYPSIKSICEGKKLPAYDAAAEFTEKIADGLDGFMEKAAGEKNALKTLEILRGHEEKLVNELSDLSKKIGGPGAGADLDKKIVNKANRYSSKQEQIDALGGQIRDNLLKNIEDVHRMLSDAAQAARDKAEETSLLMKAWGQGEDNSDPKQMQADIETMDTIRKSETLKEVSMHLGRFKEIAAQVRKNSYAYGRGEKYTLEYGNNLQRVITSEYSLLAVPETIPLFLRKYQGKKLKQYKRRERIFKGKGDIIVCLDESGSTKEQAPWGKAVALALLDAAIAGNRKFALIHFSGRGKFQTDIFNPGEFTQEDLFRSAETFLDGSTDYETPLNEALRLINDEGFEKADIVFATDGHCTLYEDFRERLKQQQAAHSFTVTGVLLDIGDPGMEFSLTPFCDAIYRTSQMAGDEMVRALITARN